VTAGGGYQCPTLCEPDCPDSCHERHKPHLHRAHDPAECDQRRLGRDVTPLAPPEYPHITPPPPKATRAAFGQALKADGVTWWRRQLLRARGPRD
jgi:hypothetical protein